MVSPEDHEANELARRLYAAYVSHQNGFTGVDTVLKIAPAEAAPFGRDLAMTLKYAMMSEKPQPNPSFCVVNTTLQ